MQNLTILLFLILLVGCKSECVKEAVSTLEDPATIEAKETLIEEVINEAVDKWLPYITINEVVTAVDATNPNRLNVSIDFSVASAPDATNQIVLDFNTTQ